MTVVRIEPTTLGKISLQSNTLCDNTEIYPPSVMLAQCFLQAHGKLST